MQGREDHHRVISMGSSLDTFLWNFIVIVAANPDVFDTLTLWDNLFCKILGGVDTIVGTVMLNRDTYSFSLSLKLEFGLEIFSFIKAHLMNDGNLTSGCIIE